MQEPNPDWPHTREQDMLSELERALRMRVLDPEDLQVYSHAIRELRCTYHIFYDMSTKMDLLDAMVWVYEVIGGFLDRLEIPTQEAVVVFVHWCVLIKRHESTGWLEGWADHLLSRAYGILDQDHRIWIAAAIEDIGWTPPV